MFKKLQASLGFGSASVDTIVQQKSLYQGEVITGTVYIKGGEVAQDIDAVLLKLCTEIKVETDNGVHFEKFVLAHIAVNSPFTIQAQEERKFDFKLPLPNEAPITAINPKRNHCQVWIETQLDIDFGIDAKDRDVIEIKPLTTIQSTLAMFEREGFIFTKADVEKGYLNGGYFKSTSGYYQELEFQKNSFFGQKEIELSFLLQNDKIHCLVEIDGKLGRKDTYRAFTFNCFASEAEIAQQLLPILRS